MEKKRNILVKKQEVQNQPFEQRSDLKKLVLYVVIVNYGQSHNICEMFKQHHSTVQFIKYAEGTAKKTINAILSVSDTRKEIVYGIMAEEYIADFKKDIEAFFKAGKWNAGIAFTIEMKSIIGVKMYKFLTQTVRG
ncbi:MAG: hypothetical protein MJ225_03185 [Bacilli bacterium]|nr:hypothetical protein [Bacilli bacterium]